MWEKQTAHDWKAVCEAQEAVMKDEGMGVRSTGANAPWFLLKANEVP